MKQKFTPFNLIKFKKLKRGNNSFFRKTTLAFLLAILVFGGVGLSPLEVFAEECTSGAPQLCINADSASPENPKYGQDDVQLHATFRIVNPSNNPNSDFFNKIIPISIKWLINPGGSFDNNEVVHEEIHNVQTDEQGNASIDLNYTFPNENFIPNETNRLAVRFEYKTSTNSILSRSDTKAIFVESLAREEPELLVSGASTAASSGLKWRFNASYIRAGESEPSNPVSLTLTWQWADASGAIVPDLAENPYEIIREFSSPGEYTLTVTTNDTLNTSVTKTFNVSGNPDCGVTKTCDDPSAGDFFDLLFGSVLTLVNIIVAALASIIRWILLAIGSWIVLPVLEATLSMTADTIAGGPILAGWTFVRDVVNMFFILGLITIGLATMLRIESYNYKKLLVNLILMAMLVNFSMLVGRVIIQITDTAQFTFLPVTEAQVSDQGGGTTGIDGLKVMYRTFVTAHVSSILDGFRAASVDTSGALAGTFTIIFQLLLELGVVITFGVIAVFMVIRTVALWLLLVLSPLAFGLAVVPATSSLSKKWWTNFFKYALFAPIMAFFLRLSMTVYSKGFGILPKTVFSDPATIVGQEDLISKVNAAGGGSFTFAQTLELGVVYVMVIALMWAGLITAKNMGIYGADGIMKLANKGLKSPLALGAWGTKRGVGYLGGKWNEATSRLNKGDATRWYNQVAFAVLNPVNFARGWEKRAGERKAERRSLAEGVGEEAASWVNTFGKEKIPAAELARRKLVNERVRDLREAMGDDIDKADAKDYWHRVANVGGLEGEFLREAYFKIITAAGYGDDYTEITSSPEWAEKYKLGRYRMSEEERAGMSEDELKELDKGEISDYNDETFQLHVAAGLGLDVDIVRKIQNEEHVLKDEEGNVLKDENGKARYESWYNNWTKNRGNQEKLKTMNDLTVLGKGVGHFEQMYTAVKESEGELKGYYRLLGASERTDMITGETVKIPIRDFMRQLSWHNFMGKGLDENGNWAPMGVVDENGDSILTDYQIKMITNMTDEYYSQATHMQSRSLKYSVGQWIEDEADGEIKFKDENGKRQWEEFEKLNEGFAHALKNVYLYGKISPNKDDLKSRTEQYHHKQSQGSDQRNLPLD